LVLPEKIDFGPAVSAPKEDFFILLAFWLIYCVTYTDTYHDVHRWMRLGDEPTFGAILWNYLFP
jgi:hypothetical protein